MEAVLNRAGAVIEKWGPACKSLATRKLILRSHNDLYSIALLVFTMQLACKSFFFFYTSVLLVDSFLVRYCDSILKSLPDLRTIISLRQQLLAGSGVKTSNTSLDNLLPGHHLRNTGQ